MATNMMNRQAVLTDNPFRKAVRQRVPIKLALVGMPGTGKTYSAMLLASQMREGGQAPAPRRMMEVA